MAPAVKAAKSRQSVGFIYEGLVALSKWITGSQSQKVKGAFGHPQPLMHIQFPPEALPMARNRLRGDAQFL
jgi:hypothetical protein